MPQSLLGFRHGGSPLRVLLTEGTSLSARHTLYALDPKYRSNAGLSLFGRQSFLIDVIDPARLCQCRFSSAVRRFTRCPHYAKQPDAFLEFLDRHLKQGEYDVILPTHEQTILLSRFRDAISSQTGFAVPSFESVCTMQDKASFMELLTSLNIPIPKTRVAESADQVRDQVFFPCFLKSAHSTAGAGVFRVEDANEFDSLMKRLEPKGVFEGGMRWLIQRPAVGVMSTVKAVFQEGRLVRIAMYQARRQGLGGMSTARQMAWHPDVSQHVSAIGQKLNWHGGMFLDYFFDPKSEGIAYLEGNPRIGETFTPTLAGINLVEDWVRISLGETMPSVIAERPSFAETRTQSLYMILISEAHAGAGRGALAGELLNHLRGRGLYEDSQDELSRPGEDWLSGVVFVWIVLQLLIWPKRAKAIVNKTINDYSLPQTSMAQVEASRLLKYRFASLPPS